jgi:hypothetical protein
VKSEKLRNLSVLACPQWVENVKRKNLRRNELPSPSGVFFTVEILLWRRVGDEAIEKRKIEIINRTS